VARLANREPVDPAAHDALLKGIYQLGRATLESTRLAIESFERAIELEPRYALAHAWLGFAWWRRTQWFGFGAQGAFGGQEVIPPLEGMPKSKAAVLRALELDDGLPEAYEGLARLAGTFDWDFAAALRYNRRALELNPSLPYSHLGLGYSLAARGRPDEGIAEGRRAVELAPFDLSVRTSLAEQYLFARRYDDALAEARKILELDPSFGPAHRLLSRIHEAQGRYEDAISDLERGETLTREQASELRAALAREGPRGYWRGMLDIVRSHPPARPDRLAKCYGELGDLDLAFAELERAYSARIPQLIQLRVNPSFDALRGDPRFDALVRRVGIPES
jgi:tetratricopeptide (TPR) repeat protein